MFTTSRPQASGLAGRVATADSVQEPVGGRSVPRRGCRLGRIGGGLLPRSCLMRLSLRRPHRALYSLGPRRSDRVLAAVAPTDTSGPVFARSSTVGSGPRHRRSARHIGPPLCTKGPAPAGFVVSGDIAERRQVLV